MGPPATKNELTVSHVEERQLAETCLQYRQKQRSGTGENEWGRDLSFLASRARSKVR